MAFMDKLLEIQHLYFAYHAREWALEDVSLSIYQGEKIAVLGSNGAGKSTLFLNMNGVLIPQDGNILYQGKCIGKKNKDRMDLRKNIGIVFQDADNQMIASNVASEVSFGPINMKLPKEEVEKRVDNALRDMNLQDYRDRAPHYLSGGEKKRVSIADILAMQPELILFDEPTTSLDPVNAEMLENVLAKLSDRKITLMVSIHDVDFAYRWADRILVFHDGKLVADDKPLKIFRDEALLKQTHLKKPMLLELWENLIEKGVVDKNTEYPKTVEKWKKAVDSC